MSGAIAYVLMLSTFIGLAFGMYYGLRLVKII